MLEVDRVKYIRKAWDDALQAKGKDTSAVYTATYETLRRSVQTSGSS